MSEPTLMQLGQDLSDALSDVLRYAEAGIAESVKVPAQAAIARWDRYTKTMRTEVVSAFVTEMCQRAGVTVQQAKEQAAIDPPHQNSAVKVT